MASDKLLVSSSPVDQIVSPGKVESVLGSFRCVPPVLY